MEHRKAVAFDPRQPRCVPIPRDGTAIAGVAPQLLARLRVVAEQSAPEEAPDHHALARHSGGRSGERVYRRIVRPPDDLARGGIEREKRPALRSCVKAAARIVIRHRRPHQRVGPAAEIRSGHANEIAGVETPAFAPSLRIESVEEPFRVLHQHASCGEQDAGQHVRPRLERP